MPIRRERDGTGARGASGAGTPPDALPPSVSAVFRRARVAAIRREIEAGTYDTPARVNAAVEAMCRALESGRHPRSA